MIRIKFIYTFLFFLLATSTLVQAQGKKKIIIEYAGRLNVSEENYPGARVLTRNSQQQVHITHAGSNMWCDKAIYYSADNFVEAYGNVIIKQGDTITMTSKYVEYSGATQLAFAHGEVILKSPNSTISTDTLYFDRIKQQSFYRSGGNVVKDSSGTITSKIGRYYMSDQKFQFVEDVVLTNEDAVIKSNYFDFYEDTGLAYLFGPSTITTEESETYCEKGFYDTKNKFGYALKNSKIHYDDRIIEGDSLYFDNTRSFSSATNNIKVTDTINNSIVTGHYAEVYKDKDSLFITKRALVTTVQEKDSVYLHADKIMVTGKPENRITRAYYNAKLYKSDISAKADSIHTDQKTGITELINLDRFASTDAFSTKRRPILWNNENQMTGDTIHLFANSKTEKLDSLAVFNNAFIISKDTISENGYNQIFGIKLVGYFNEANELREVNINKNAESIFYTRDEKQELIGIDKAKSGSIRMLFANSDIEEYTRLNVVDGTLYPEEDYKEKDKFLKGFDWREDERPQSVEDIFKEDEPFELAVIKGLEDYVPQENFFDEELLDRINERNNILESGKNFDSNDWKGTHIVVEPNIINSPNEEKTADKLTHDGSSFGWITQKFKINEGHYNFSVWLKGKGSIYIELKVVIGDASKRKTSQIILTPEWKKHTISFEKDDNPAESAVTFSLIKNTDDVYAWGASLLKVSAE
ncbi:OstA-like protein [Algibacter miyuki]|uniref:OstA-like protein n=1 Tax=Algibacter miyuki TaxID=1306933 RepID=A0ABV5H3U8_9FLAO|nr:OstA-like protein [Algibacter miyuki]MDN3665494.1 OstA-like protein [Algibacter miyuki]